MSTHQIILISLDGDVDSVTLSLKLSTNLFDHQCLPVTTKTSDEDREEDFRLDDKIGTLEIGKKADITLLRNNDLNLKNSFNPLHSIICYGHPGNVDTVIIEGEIMKQNGKLNFADLDTKLSNLESSGRKIYNEFKSKAATADFG